MSLRVCDAGLQTVQYIQPQHHERLGQAELLVIDEAAAIPLPLVKSMLGPYLVFLCSTVNGSAESFTCHYSHCTSYNQRLSVELLYAAQAHCSCLMCIANM